MKKVIVQDLTRKVGIVNIQNLVIDYLKHVVGIFKY